MEGPTGTIGVLSARNSAKSLAGTNPSFLAQMINVLQSMILTDKEKMVLTPAYYIYKMYVPFQDATFVPLEP